MATFNLSRTTPITEWPEQERPRERLLAQGPVGLSDAELLAIFLRVGVTGKSAVDLARELIARFHNLHSFFSASREDLCAVHCIGEAKYVQLQAVLEMSNRRGALQKWVNIGCDLTNGGFRRVRPLHGGLDAWIAAGYSVEEI